MQEPLTAQEWAVIFPAWPEERHVLAAPVDIIEINNIDVLALTLLYVAWPGSVEPDEVDAAGIMHRIGRWYVIPDGIGCLGTDLFIEAERLDEHDWLHYLLRRKHIYDPSDFLKILALAWAHFRPEEADTQGAAAIQHQIERATQHHALIVHPDLLRHSHVYYVQRMQREGQRTAFCQFLAAQAYVPQR